MQADNNAPSIETLQKRVKRSKLSSIGATITKIVRLTQDPGSCANELTTLTEQDPSLATAVLRRANSASFGMRQQISSVQQAIVLMGFNTVREIALSFSTSQLFRDEVNIGDYSREALWKHSLGVALLCKNISRKLLGVRNEEIYTAGLLHDIGILAEEELIPDVFTDVIHSWKNNGDLCNFERKFFGYDHTKVGAALTENWDFPPQLINAIRYHHAPPLDASDAAWYASIVYMADFAGNAFGIGFTTAEEVSQEQYDKCLRYHGTDQEAVEILVEEVGEELEERERAGELFE